MTNNDDGRFGPISGENVFASPQITTEDLLNMRVAPEQRADLLAVQEALGIPLRHRNETDTATHDGPSANCRECAYETGAYL